MQRWEVETMTPEQVPLVFEVAGIGTRGIAQILDILFLTIGFGIFWTATYAAAVLSYSGTILDYIVGIEILLNFVSIWLYFILFEYFWSGQTLGKRIVRIRVIRTNGMPLTFFASLVRNLIRIIDIIPLYGIGVFCMMITKLERRVGDLAAGTIVVKDTFRTELGLLNESNREPVRSGEEIQPDSGLLQFLQIESKHVKIILTEKLPADIEESFRKFVNRKKQLTRTASEKVACNLWAMLEQLPMVRIELASNKTASGEEKILKKSIVEICVKLGKELNSSK